MADKLVYELRLEEARLARRLAGVRGAIQALSGRAARSHHAKAGAPKSHGRKWSQADRDKMSRLIKAKNAAKKKAAGGTD